MRTPRLVVRKTGIRSRGFPPREIPEGVRFAAAYT
jgi:hypothetical protein